MDFTLTQYRTLIETLQQQGFSFQTLTNLLEEPGNKVIVLRHDVDKIPGKSLDFARIQADRGIKGTYYFRIVQESFDEKIIKEIYSLGHEVGYHYEDVSLVAKGHRAQGTGHRAQGSGLRAQGTGRRAQYSEQEEELAKIAIESFTENLEKLRKIVPVKTICMHGSPMSRWDSRLLWKYYDYHDFRIVGEPYFDINFDEVLYLTDTGRRWDGDSVNIRDKAVGERQKAEGGIIENALQPSALSLQPHSFSLKFHSTFDIIQAAEQGILPDKIMMTFHPQRWTDKPVPWVKELVWQNVKNVAKYFIVKVKSE